MALLIEQPNTDINCATPDGITPLDMVHSPDYIRLLLEHGATPTYQLYEEYFPIHLQKEQASMSVKMFVLGNSGAGKSTLVKSLETETEGLSRFLNQFVKVKDVDKKTAGIIPHDINSKSLGPVTIFDFAGHREFYAGHDTLLHNSMANSPSIILLVVDMRNEKDKLGETLFYWLEFINNHCLENGPKPHLIIICSHADQSSDVNAKSQLTTSIIESYKLTCYKFVRQVIMDCRFAESSSMSALRLVLTQSCQDLRNSESRTVAIENHCFLVFLLDKVRDKAAIKLSTAKAMIETESYLKFLKSYNLFTICEQLNERGNILFMKNHDNHDNSWIVLNKALLLSRVNGSIFVPEGFMKHQKVATSTGVVLLSKLVSLFPDLDLDMITQFLCHMEFCQEITDLKLLSLFAPDNISSSPNERFYFFPGLVHLDRPQNLWQPNTDFGYYTGWLLRCSEPKQFFTTQFLHVLLLRMAFYFVLAPSEPSHVDNPALQRRCSVWKDGISWANLSGSKAIVEVVNQKQVVVMTRCDGNRMESLKLRTGIIKTVLEAKDEICPKVLAEELLIFPEDAVYYPFILTNVITVSIADVAQTIKAGETHIVIKNSQPVKLERLLHFEPYANLGLPILQKFFQEDKPEYRQIIMTNNLINSFTDKAYKSTSYFADLFQPSHTQLDKDAPQRETHYLVRVLQLWRDKMGTKGTCFELRKKLDQFSIFAGRNPLNLVTGMHVYKYITCPALRLPHVCYIQPHIMCLMGCL